jgi:formylglycine-generating enzyme required for sulfatase activity
MKKCKCCGQKIKEISWTKIGNLEWSGELGEMDWHKAKKECKKLGGRLPTRVELIDLFENHEKERKKLIKDLPSNSFWSLTETSAANAWAVDLGYGSTYGCAKTTPYQVRCVRERGDL